MDLVVKRSIIIDKPVDDVWKFLWDDFDSLHKSFANVKECKLLKEGDEGGVVEGVDAVVVNGICGREILLADGQTVKEMLIKVDKENGILSYNLIGMPMGLPLIGTWYVSKSGDGDDKAQLEVEDKINLSYWPPTFLMYPLLKIMLPGVADAMLSDCKHYVETGEPSPAKVEAMKKAEAAAAESAK